MKDIAVHLINLSLSELEQFVVSIGEQKFRAKQISEWLWRGAPNFSVMKNLPENLREKLDEIAGIMPVKVVKKIESSDGQTTKFLLELSDGEQIETVLMRTSYGASVCVSSQAGCAMGCAFCASTLLGLKRNLTATEMISQVLVCQWELRPDEVSHIVVMGTGEPLYNCDNLREFLEMAHDKLSIGWRKMTVSTCGIVPGIIALTEWGRPVNLAISLHAPTDVLRSQIMPINNKYKIADVMDVATAHADATGRQLMIEYILIADKNDSVATAQELAALLRDKNAMVNLIPLNPVAERPFVAPSNNTVHRFADTLKSSGVHTRIRRERGADIGSACGQLRNSREGGNPLHPNE